MSRPYHGGSARRPPSPRPVDWIAAVEQATRLARAAVGGAEVPSVAGGDTSPEGGGLGDLVQFRLRVRDLTAESFPPPAEASRLLAAAFLNVGRAFAHPATSPETRTACAGLLGEAARCVDEVFARHRAALAAGSWGRQSGGFD